MRILKGLGCAIVLALGASGALAGGSLKDTAPPAPTFNWSGFYVGAFVGHASVDTKAESSFDSPPFVTDMTVHDRNFVGGVEVGYSRQFGDKVIGVVVDWTSLRADSFGLVDTTGLDEIYAVTVNDMITVRGKLGHSFGNFVPYITGGIAFAKVSAGYENYSDGTRTVLDETTVASSRQTGWVAGVGVDIALRKDLFAKIEYLHADFGSFDAGWAPLIAGETLTFKPTVDLVKIGVSFKF